MNVLSPRVIFLDVGGVLLNNAWGHESRTVFCQNFNLNYKEFEVLHQFVFNLYEIGKISLDEYIETTVFNHPRTFDKEEVREFMFSQSVLLPNMLQWLIEWKAKYKIPVFSLNNEGKELNNYRIEKFGLHRCFDGFISSCEVGMRKPDPEMYKLARGIVQMQPHECAYFDDRIMLVNAAAKHGIHSFHHQDFESTKKIFDSFTIQSHNE
ncbi:HAD family hydrolase [Albibacterium bauzanense]|uniref:Putative hydrolase of the HAD superfamily n=1 Tax=Albibacterium bauzanense TaxID=653929 RepID=A0A4R1LPC4_9SPHI|nr:HAD-IA family hydrolase [Albibacterium bauzanense]TCK80675.1 putative hydrolase of the HAD superfamily [Albibacterium bauzanense]